MEEKERRKLEEIRVKEKRKKERDDRQKTAKKIKELKRNANFTQSEHKQFSKRFENQYDIPDKRYELWVQLYRSDVDVVPQSETGSNSDVQNFDHSMKLRSGRSTIIL
uniref:Uncharacterized protein n=1 Tax=Amphimedon queenslandica TaxID=400682 RepID=A0A1X7TYL5_AMPQE